MNELVTKTLAVAKSQIGVREAPLGSNRGPQVDAYLRTCHLPPGEPWCAAFVAWCFEQAAFALGLKCTWPDFGYCPSLQSWAKAQGILDREPVAGDVFLLTAVRGGRPRAFHTGFVTNVAGETIKTIEGNTNLGGSPAGIGVFERIRTVRSDLLFVGINTLALQPGFDGVWTVAVGATAFPKLGTRDGEVLVPLRALATALGKSIEWHAEIQAVVIDGKRCPFQITLRDGVAYAPVRELAQDLGLRLDVAQAAKTITLRP